MFKDSEFPKLPGVNTESTYIYSLFSDGVCVYVGQTINLKVRTYQHLADGKSFNSLEYFVCNNEDANEEEVEQIVKMNPALNQSLPSTSRYVSLSEFKKNLNASIMNNKGSFDLKYSRECGYARKHNWDYISKEQSDELIKEIVQVIINYKGGGQ